MAQWLDYPHMRLFVGIPLADAVVGELGALVSRLRTGVSGLRWSAPESWHITLQFLGNAAPEKMDCLAARLGEVRSGPIAIEVGKLGCFDRAGVFFAEVAVSPELAALQQRVVAATGLCGFAAEARPFYPHITLARKAGTGKSEDRATRGQGSKNSPGGTEGLRDLMARAGASRFSRFTANEFLLYESHPGAGGSRYEVRKRVALEKARLQRQQDFDG